MVAKRTLKTFSPELSTVFVVSVVVMRPRLEECLIRAIVCDQVFQVRIEVEKQDPPTPSIPTSLKSRCNTDFLKIMSLSTRMLFIVTRKAPMFPLTSLPVANRQLKAKC